ncbi:hypothetical protein [Microbulbifer variabilis]|uniref:hypothetical protein n=1 Tax=Microbulbifer variabilis TaxID=266805 RepID=UPI001CFECC6C|nr:hypothetical protein [Microbulbifer variabilis]
MMKYTPLLLLLMWATPENVFACMKIAPLMLKEYEGMSVYESNLASSDIAFRGYLIQAETTARASREEGGARIYKYLVIEPFKGNIKKNEIVEISQNRTYCSFTYSIDKEHLVYLTKDKNGLYQFGMANSGPLLDQILDMEKEEDVEFYQEIVEAGRGSDYVVRSYFPDGKPRIYTYSVEKQLDKVRAASLFKSGSQ